jgi:hydroxypyruvate isomerase
LLAVVHRAAIAGAGAAKAAGFDAVEFWWPFESPVPGTADTNAFIRAINNAGVQLVGL